MGPRIWVLGDVPQGDVQMGADFPSGFLCDPYVPSEPGSGFVAGPHSPQGLGDHWGVPAGENGDGADIFSQERPWVLPGSPQLCDVEWDNWTHDLGRYDAWPTGVGGPSAPQGLDPEWSVQHDGEIHSLYGDLPSPGDSTDERRTGVAPGAILEGEHDRLESIRQTVESAREAMMVVDDKERDRIGKMYDMKK